MGKVDTKGIDELFIETPIKGLRDLKRPNPPKIHLEAIKPAENSLQGVSSLRLVRELGVRHYKFVLTALFWGGVGALIVILGR